MASGGRHPELAEDQHGKVMQADSAGPGRHTTARASAGVAHQTAGQAVV